MARHEPRISYGPCCGEPLDYVGYYRCPACKQQVDMKDMVLESEAARIRRERGQGELFAEADPPQATSSHDCPASGCDVPVSPQMLMCRTHWYMVPSPLRSTVWSAWDNGHGAGTPAHQEAILAAVQAVNDKLAGVPQ